MRKVIEEKKIYLFSELSDEDLEEACKCNDWEFLEDGSIY